MRFIACLSLSLAISPSMARAEPPTLHGAPGNPEDLKVSASVRVRYEALDGQSRVGLNPTDEQLAIRTTLFAEYGGGPIKVGGELYDSRVYLAERGSALSSNDVNTFELVQAYLRADLSNPLGAGSKGSIQTGRFTLNLGSRRLVAADDYRNSTNGYTGLRADLAVRDGTAATLIFVLPQVRLPDDQPSLLDNRTKLDRESFDLQLWGGLITRPRTIFGGIAELSYFRLQESDGQLRPTRNRNLHSVGMRTIRDPKPGQWDFEAEGIYQFGTVRSGLAAAAPVLDVAASFVHADLGYSFTGPRRVRLSVEYDRASGDGAGKSFGRFDTLFGMRRADLAPAGIYAQIGRANISTPGIRIEAAPTPRLDGFAVYRAMWLADRRDAFSTTGVRDASGNSGRFAGHQIEGRLRYWLVPKFLRAELNAAYLAKGRFLKNAPNAPQGDDTRYLAIGIMATF